MAASLARWASPIAPAGQPLAEAIESLRSYAARGKREKTARKRASQAA